MPMVYNVHSPVDFNNQWMQLYKDTILDPPVQGLPYQSIQKPLKPFKTEFDNQQW